MRKYLVSTAGAIAMGMMLLVSVGSASADKDNHQHQNNQGDRNGTVAPHSCVNPAGNVRGWCKHNTDTDNDNDNKEHNTNNCNNGTYNCNNGTYNRNNTASVSGIITGISGTRVRLLQGLSSITINDSRAVNSGLTSNLYVGRSVTAYGYWSGSVFYANRIG
jgi:hypothetical protein